MKFDSTPHQLKEFRMQIKNIVFLVLLCFFFSFFFETKQSFVVVFHAFVSMINFIDKTQKTSGNCIVFDFWLLLTIQVINSINPWPSVVVESRDTGENWNLHVDSADLRIAWWCWRWWCSSLFKVNFLDFSKHKKIKDTTTTNVCGKRTNHLKPTDQPIHSFWHEIVRTTQKLYNWKVAHWNQL